MLVDTGAEASLIKGTPKQFSECKVITTELGGKQIEAIQDRAKAGVSGIFTLHEKLSKVSMGLQEQEIPFEQLISEQRKQVWFTEGSASYQGNNHVWNAVGYQTTSIHSKEVWGKELWQDIWAIVQMIKVTVFHVDAICASDTLERLFNSVTDEQSKISVTESSKKTDTAEELLGLTQWAQTRGVPIRSKSGNDDPSDLQTENREANHGKCGVMENQTESMDLLSSNDEH
ncbi:uncharacterized protein [Phyllobates terribilis]|uniref:uncharacterized protein n=1 Tax=Phyllobates terribilis TaxID=111132 RepID=UPI003CCB1211